MKVLAAGLSTIVGLSTAMLASAPASAVEQCQMQRSVKEGHRSTEKRAKSLCTLHLRQKGFC